MTSDQQNMLLSSQQQQYTTQCTNSTNNNISAQCSNFCRGIYDQYSNMCYQVQDPCNGQGNQSTCSNTLKTMEWEAMQQASLNGSLNALLQIIARSE